MRVYFVVSVKLHKWVVAENRHGGSAVEVLAVCEFFFSKL